MVWRYRPQIVTACIIAVVTWITDRIVTGDCIGVEMQSNSSTGSLFSFFGPVDPNISLLIQSYQSTYIIIVLKLFSEYPPCYCFCPKRLFGGGFIPSHIK